MSKSFGGQRFKWDTKSVVAAVGKVKAEAMRISGAEIQRAAKKSMKRPGKKTGEVSRPGSPPHVRRGHLRNSIRFAWDEKARSVVVGPIRFKGRSDGAAVHEKGGTKTVLVYERSYREWLQRDRRPERGYDPTIDSKHTRDKKKRGLPPIPEGQMKNIRKYYDRHQPGTVQVTKKPGKFAPRPFMAPALKAVIPKVPEILKKAKTKFK